MSNTRANPILLAVADVQVQTAMQQALQAGGFNVLVCRGPLEIERELQRNPLALLLLGEQPPAGSSLGYAAQLCQRYPLIWLLVVGESDPQLLNKALRSGIHAYLSPSADAAEVQGWAATSQSRAKIALQLVRAEAQRAAEPIQHQVDDLRAIERLGQSITANLNLDQVLTAIVDAGVSLTNAEEGSLLLLDHATGELYMRAARNFDADFVETFRLPIHDALVSQVLHSGEPVLVDNSQPQKIKTAYLVHNLVYVPLKLHGTVIGILVVDNRTSQTAFSEGDVRVLSALAEYAVIALENARIFTEMTAERNERETILRGISDGVMVVDQDQRLKLVNQAAITALDLQNEHLDGRPVRDVISNPDILALIENGAAAGASRIEMLDEHERAWNVSAVDIPGVGLAITLHDVTQFKKMERIKSDFVSTVSHDLRSPLTAIMGYVELIGRAGPVNDIQADFIQRVLASVQNITSLINNLVSLGQIEAGFEAQHEAVQLKNIVEYVLDGFQKPIEEKNLHVRLEMDDLPPVLANAVQMRQMVEHLLDNAIKYNQQGGSITVRGTAADNQLILQISDTGRGISSLELLFVFDKFYRASNVDPDVHGTGLGLAIVKSIVEKHQGRTWVESNLGQGSTFTVVLPVA